MITAVDTQAWMADASCAGLTPAQADQYFYAPGQIPSAALRMCGACPVRTDCANAALTLSLGFGVWGGVHASTIPGVRTETFDPPAVVFAVDEEEAA